MKEKLVVIGNGMAGMRTVEELLDVAPEDYDITVFGAEPHGNYNRILLSPVLSGEKSFKDIMINDDSWYSDNSINLRKGHDVTKIDRQRRVVIDSTGTETPYDRLLLATGSDPIVLPFPGHDLPGVVTFRDIHDVERMHEATEKGGHAVVIGGGLLGLEAANGLMKKGMAVTVVHLMDTLMERQLDDVAAEMLRQSLEAKGLEFKMPAETAAILGTDHVEGVRFKDGEQIPADLVVMAVGIRPNTTLAQEAFLHCERGVIVSDTLQTYDPRIYAVGECVQHRGTAYGLVAPLFEQAKVAARQLAQRGHAAYSGSVTSTKLKVTGIDVFSAGDFHDSEDTEAIVLRDPGRGVYKKLVLRDNRIVGAVMFGDATDGSWFFQLLRDETDVSEMREQLLFGPSHLGDSGHGGHDAATAMSDDQEVCGCNGVCKGDITSAIVEKNLFTLEDVRAHTKASSSCGSCTGLVEQILASTLGGDYSEAPAVKSMCACTEHSHDEVRRTIVDQGLKSVGDVMAFLEWREADGCAKCRPALNYYLICAWPGEYTDDAQSRFINERVHANIQKDGTYSVIPRMWGGVTTPDELRAIADVADKFEIPAMKVTGGQRIDLLGVHKEDLPAVWKDLNQAGLVSGHAYGKALRTVKTCVGSEWCRFGTQDSTAMGIALERMCWRSWTPHKFKIAVSGCPRNCAEATIKDFGVVAVESGWELHVGGNGGVKVRATDLLCKVTSDEEVMEYAASFMQIYREEAHYLERTAPWIERVGLAYIKNRLIEDADGRVRLAERFHWSQKFSQADPWDEVRKDADRQAEFMPIKTLSREKETV